MINTSQGLSETGQRAQADPIAIIFNKVMPAQAANPDFVSFAAGPPDNNLLPNDLLKSLIDDAVETYGVRLLNYTKPEGLPPLAMVLEHMLMGQGVICSANQMLITSGGMEAISMTAQLTLSPGDTLLVESPAFPGALATFKLAGANIVQVDCDQEGMKTQALKTAIKQHKPKLVSVMPDYQNPSGKVMSLKRRQEIAQVLKDTGTYAVEDGVYSLLRFAGRPIQPLQSLAPDLVFYAASVSKILAPGMRVGALITPNDDMQKRAANIKSTYNMQASGFNQAISERFLNPGRPYLKDQLEKLAKAYLSRRDKMITELEKNFPEGYTWTKPDGGMFLWVTGPKGVDFAELLDAAIEKGVAYVPGNMFYVDHNTGRNEIRLNFASTPEDKIAEGIDRLASVVKG